MQDVFVLKKSGLFYGKQNITEIMPTMLDKQIKLVGKVTLRDIFKLLKVNENFFNLLYCTYNFVSYLEEALTLKRAKPKLKALGICTNVNVDIAGKEYSTNMYIDAYALTKRHERMTLTRMPIQEILDVPIVYEPGMIIVNNDFYKYYPEIFRLDSMLRGIFSEISFYGTSKEKEEKRAEIFKIKDEVIKNLGGKPCKIKIKRVR